MINAGGVLVSVGIIIPNPTNPNLPYSLSTYKHLPVVLVPAQAPRIAAGGTASFVLNLSHANIRYGLEIAFRAEIAGNLMSFSGLPGSPLSVVTALPQPVIIPPYTGAIHVVSLPLVYNGGNGRERISLIELSHKVQGNPTMGRPHQLPPLAVEIDF